MTILGHAMVLLTLNYVMSTTLGSYLGTIFIGFGYSITVSSMWPLVALIVPEHKQGTAYGNFLLIYIVLTVTTCIEGKK